MGILNVTPDSFSDGGLHLRLDDAIRHAHRMLDEGASILDVGGESTRPGAEPVSEQQELDRIIPVIERLHRETQCLISVDTIKPAVMDAACVAGARMINDVYALRMPGAVDVARRHNAIVCLMHMQGEPRTMQLSPHYADVVGEVSDFLDERRRACVTAGIAEERIVLDPGIGFGKTLAHNLELLANLDRITPAGSALMVGVSRKTMLGQLLDAALDQRLHGGIAVAALAAWQGVAIVRAHDVRATVDALETAVRLRRMRR
ncbi:MAG: dihydropteroate synthase [Stenotrophobium sp.]